MLTIPLSSKMDCCGTSISAGCFFWVCYLQTEKKNMVSCAIPSVKCPFTCLFVFFLGGGIYKHKDLGSGAMGDTKAINCI